MAAKKASASVYEESPLELYAVAAIAVVWIVLMTHHLGERSLNVDEFITAYRVANDLMHKDKMHPATYYRYVRFWTDAVGHSDAGLRSSSLIPAAVAVICVGVVAWWLLPWPAWAVALILVCLSAELLLYWRMARYFAGAAAGYGIAMVGGVGYLRERRASWAAVMAAGSVAAVFVDYVAAAGTTVVWLWVFAAQLRARRRRAAAGLAALAVGVLAAATPAIRWALRGARKVMRLGALVYPAKTYILAAALAAWNLLASECLPPWQPWVAFPTAAASAALIAVGAAEAWRRETPWRLVVIAWPSAVAIAFILVLLTPHEPPMRVASLALYALPYAMLVMALGWHVAWPKAWGKVATIVLASGYITSVANYYGMRNHLNPQYAMDWRAVGRYIAARASGDDWIVTFYDASFHRYYKGPGRQADIRGLNQRSAREVLQALRDGATVWLVLRDRGSLQARQLAQSFINAAVALGAKGQQSFLMRYAPAERAWRRLMHLAPAEGYVTIYRLWLPAK